MFINGQQEASDTYRHDVALSPGDGRIVLGRTFTDRDEKYSSVMIDDLTYFNQALTNEEIRTISYTVN